MARLTKATLKELLRECLVEILEEENVFLVKEKKDLSLNSKYNKEVVNQQIQTQEQQSFTENPILKESINNLANNLSILDKTKRDLFADIFEDTAKTTYQDMLENDVSYVGPARPPTEEQKQRDVQSLKEIAHGGDFSRWAKVAFAGSNKK